MAAPAGKVVGVSDDSSSSDEEERKRFQEAVWETRTNTTKEGGSDGKESKRFVVADHEHDGNELQVTQGFQKHVAKKLGHFLDSSISEMEPGSSLSVKSEKCDEDDDEDEGFRLFSTSVPGQKCVDPPAPLRRRRIPSSSDSDSEMETRLREAAVSVRDLLPPSTLASLPSPPQTGDTSSDKIQKKKKKKTASDGEESQVVEKQKKRKQSQEESEQVDSAGLAPCAQSNGKPAASEQDQAKVKRKKKKRQKGNTETF
ncbi:protein CUSTOS [Parambassis ranga]|uniref:Protein CUSTOS n=1 Tax=Parambassis ranga TaxID=210632 RepID=A0A6P7J348_9TELE|nr:protein CUSTOS [Parambassis ranga]XP_028270931.1 protein CUSTOS [Parambassis ranga]